MMFLAIKSSLNRCIYSKGEVPKLPLLKFIFNHDVFFSFYFWHGPCQAQNMEVAVILLIESP